MENQLSLSLRANRGPTRTDWLALLRPFGVEEAAAQEVLEKLVQLYLSEGRYHHTLRHVQEVLQAIDELSHLTKDLAAVRLAGWFHDAIYDSPATDNEERSADLCGQELARLHVPKSTADAALAMIRSTRDHMPSPGDLDCQVLLDADLAILGSSPARYAEYAAAIRQEYAWVPEADYRTGRARILESFLRRERIYFTEPMLAALEAPARGNLQTEIKALTRAD